MVSTKYVAPALLAGLLPQTFAQDDDGKAKFTYPNQDDGRLKFYDNTEVVVGFECPKETVDLRIFCRNEDDEEKVDEVALFKDVACADEEYTFRVDFDYYASRCWLNMRDNDGSGDIGTNSPGFELSRTAADQTFGLDRPTAASTIPSSSTPSSTSTADSHSGADSPSSNDSDGLSTGAKAGIGVGVSLGVLGIAALVGAFCVVRRRKQRATASNEDPSYGQRPNIGSEMDASEGRYTPVREPEKYAHHDGVTYVKSPNYGAPSELADTGRIHHELP